MKKLIFLFVFFVFAICKSLHAQDNRIVVAIAVEKKYCGSSYYYSHLGYAWWSGIGSYSELEQKAKNDVGDRFSNYDFITSTYGPGNYLLIISTNKAYQTCGRYTIGVGIADNADKALEKAKENLYGTNWSWGRNDSYDVLLSRAF